MTASPTPPDETPSSLTFFKGINAFTQLFDPIGNMPDQPPEQPADQTGEQAVETTETAETAETEVKTDEQEESAQKENDLVEETDKDAEDVIIGSGVQQTTIEEESKDDQDKTIVGEEDVRVGSSSSSSQSSNIISDENKTGKYDDNDDVVIPDVGKSTGSRRESVINSENRPRSSQSRIEERIGSAKSLRPGSGRNSVGSGNKEDLDRADRRHSSTSSSRLIGSAKDKN